MGEGGLGGLRSLREADRLFQKVGDGPGRCGLGPAARLLFIDSEVAGAKGGKLRHRFVYPQALADKGIVGAEFGRLGHLLSLPGGMSAAGPMTFGEPGQSR